MLKQILHPRVAKMIGSKISDLNTIFAKISKRQDDIYTAGALLTGSYISAGNIYSNMDFNDYGCRGEGNFLSTLHSCCKGAIYGTIWPLFFAHVCYRKFAGRTITVTHNDIKYQYHTGDFGWHLIIDGVNSVRRNDLTDANIRYYVDRKLFKKVD